MRRVGYTIVELLIVIAIVGVLVALLLPAIQAARESARQAHCKNNLRQISTALLDHHGTLNHFPFGGWGHEWIGLPDRGSRDRQPGSWIYGILPFTDQHSLHELGHGASAADLSRRLETPLSLFTCPTRRPCRAWPISDRFAYVRTPKPAGSIEVAARSDYAINAGATGVRSFPGPPSLSLGDASSFNWPMADGSAISDAGTFTGISHIRSGCSLQQIEDGTSNTYLTGEKFLDPNHYLDGEDLGDNESLYSGYCTDNHRFTRMDLTPWQDVADVAQPSDYMRFGSAHAAGVNMAFADGSVRLIDYEIDAAIHHVSGHRSDHGK